MMQFTKATVHQARLRLALIGPAGSGKTYSALGVATHLGQRIAVIDTERGSASKYAGLFAFDVLELTSFAPQTYVQAIQTADAAGYDVLVIDSLSHAWMGKDGALEMVDRAGKRSPSGNSFAAWRDVTPHHNAMVDAILACRAHVIATLRAKTEYVQDKDAHGKTVIRKIGLAPVQRDGLEYEFDVVGDLDQDHTLVVTKSRCPALADTVMSKPGQPLAEALRAWLGQGEAPVVKPVPLDAAAAATVYAAERRAVPVQRCRSCGAPVIWAKTAAGKDCPYDADAQGNNSGVSHFTTCPEASDWSTGKRPAPNGQTPPPQDDDEPASVHIADDFETALDAALKAPAIRFPRNAPGMQEFIKLVELPRPAGLDLDADARKAALGGKSVNKYMTDQGWQDDPAALDRVWAVLLGKVSATEAAEVAATE